MIDVSHLPEWRNTLWVIFNYYPVGKNNPPFAFKRIALFSRYIKLKTVKNFEFIQTTKCRCHLPRSRYMHGLLMFTVVFYSNLWGIRCIDLQSLNKRIVTLTSVKFNLNFSCKLRGLRLIQWNPDKGNSDNGNFPVIGTYQSLLFQAS